MRGTNRRRIYFEENDDNIPHIGKLKGIKEKEKNYIANVNMNGKNPKQVADRR